MNGDFVSLTNDALWLVLVLSAPPIIVAAVAGLIVAVLQAATQVQEQTLQYTVKFFAIVLTLFLTAALLGGSLYRFSDRIFTNFPAMIQH
ncbi:MULTISPECIES: type III secretion system export apparatus subunit SctS [Sphingomonas]|jgi:type III secretion protein S|uniref:EscS/YscS/HrcS family type III secretion system export apparatus protein n=2 Tax=Sphingomonas TaxID=13687 RepID=A0A2A4I8B3_9SPHN|nr:MULTISPECIES: type III secretion system export apparatus subunit SctS [Sphingomonas]MBY0301020.1 type III secretion system export apparatus subunit SctS [Sphingomonas ginsenosidimutans]PCG09457.1 EscS/YscS/HrcS family type III secretion system export apparatus protein [Sphingomonas ginsenosidimutans]PCG14033.1 EscS/YscS/HrcS family type III secretion system export apparatus protein [Sphingomonas adhaesiva]PZU82064.1 MAG: EscS/YscS/HrcS family type III secretion system export apparatus protei